MGLGPAAGQAKKELCAVEQGARQWRNHQEGDHKEGDWSPLLICHLSATTYLHRKHDLAVWGVQPTVKLSFLLSRVSRGRSLSVRLLTNLV